MNNLQHLALRAALLFLLMAPAGFAQENPGDDAEILTRGPVHEAFAATINYNPEPGLVAPKQVPDPIEELPPDLKPEGENVVWIPGYWAWDEELDNFIWISGVWRNIPPGRQWIPGYWNQTSAGFQWVSGYWSDVVEAETRYYPEPPASLESGPNIAAPSINYVWVPGCWVWQNRYVWQPGYWTPGRADLIWIPASYAWTPRGVIYIGGYWDYPVVRRGVIFAPVYWSSPVYVRRHYSYSPSVVISLSIFSDSLFIRPRYRHYYFGDYYGRSYHDRGIYTSININIGTRNRAYDPIYSHNRWQHRNDRNWEANRRRDYEYRRDNESARPARTFAEQNRRSPGNQRDSQRTNTAIATPISQASSSGNRSLVQVNPAERTILQNESRQRRELGQVRQKQELARPSVLRAARTESADNVPERSVRPTPDTTRGIPADPTPRTTQPWNREKIAPERFQQERKQPVSREQQREQQALEVRTQKPAQESPVLNRPNPRPEERSKQDNIHRVERNQTQEVPTQRRIEPSNPPFVRPKSAQEQRVRLETPQTRPQQNPNRAQTPTPFQERAKLRTENPVPNPSPNRPMPNQSPNFQRAPNFVSPNRPVSPPSGIQNGLQQERVRPPVFRGENPPNSRPAWDRQPGQERAEKKQKQ